MPWKSDREDEFFYLKLVLALAVAVAVIAGLIEWNARRQAAAFTRELTLREPTGLTPLHKGIPDQVDALPQHACRSNPSHSFFGNSQMQPFQAIEAQYAAIRSINKDAGDFMSRLLAVLAVTTQVFPAIFGATIDLPWWAPAVGFVFASAILAAFLDLRREKLAAEYWNADWIPSPLQRLLSGLFLVLTIVLVALSARFNALIGFAVFLVIGHLPLRLWVNRLAT